MTSELTYLYICGREDVVTDDHGANVIGETRINVGGVNYREVFTQVRFTLVDAVGVTGGRVSVGKSRINWNHIIIYLLNNKYGRTAKRTDG